MDESTMSQWWEAFEDRWRAWPEVAGGPLRVCLLALDQEPPRVVLGSGVSDGRVTAALGRDQSPVVFTSAVTGERIRLTDAARTLGVHPVKMEQARDAVRDGLEQSESVAGRTSADRAPLPQVGERPTPFVRDSEGRVLPEESAAVMFLEDWEDRRGEGFEVRWLGMNAGATGADVQIVHAGSWVTASYDSEREPEMTVKAPSGEPVDLARATALLGRPEQEVKDAIDAVTDSSAVAWMEHGSAIVRREAEEGRSNAPTAEGERTTARERNRARIEGGTRCGIQRQDPLDGGPSAGRKPSR